MNNDHKNFNDFTKGSNLKNPPKNIDQSVYNYIRSDLKPNHITVLAKVFLTQTIIGIITLTFCPQFNVSLTQNYQLFHFFHHNFGEFICYTVCGVIFLGTGALIATRILNSSELKKLNKYKLIYFSFVALLNLFLLISYSGQYTFAGITFWLIGAIGGSALIIYIHQKFKYVFSF